MSLGRWQPDLVCISFTKKKIAIGPELEVSPPPTLGWLPSTWPIVGRLGPMVR